MSYQYIAGVGLVHFNEDKPPRVVPVPERHRWAISKLPWGESTT
ncbi:hypothetical protein [Spirosoma oryzicola]|nr:hypothetical protein [Spirosoma oryzicola]